MTQSRQVDVVRVAHGSRATALDRAAVEEPLEVRLHGKAFAVIMRTPGSDQALAAGFLLAERVIGGADDLGTIEYCRDGGAMSPNVVNVTLAGTAPARLEHLLSERRQVMTNSSCGLCGRLTIESLRCDIPALAGAAQMTAPVLASLPDRLRTAQPLFDETGGLHACGLFGLDGVLAASAEDVGRHNAVDKVVGRMLMQDLLPLTPYALCVSGRTSFEIVQKAWLAGVSIVASVSAPSSLAIELAHEAGVTLVGFVRGGSFNIYAHPERIA